MTNTQLLFSIIKQSICLDIDCIIILINKQFLLKQTFYTVTHHMSSFILVWKLNIIIHNSDQYIKIDIYLINVDDHTAVITQEIYIVDDLWAKMLVDIDVLVTEDIIINLSQKITVIDSCVDIKVSFTITTKFINQISKIILVKQCAVISSHNNLVIIIIKLDLSDSHNFLFKSDCC